MSRLYGEQKSIGAELSAWREKSMLIDVTQTIGLSFATYHRMVQDLRSVPGYDTDAIAGRRVSGAHLPDSPNLVYTYSVNLLLLRHG